MSAHGYRIEEGVANADIYCPYEIAVANLNLFDYALPYDAPQRIVTDADLDEWLRENVDDLPEYCFAHRGRTR